jgi:hypothetical protein
MKKNFNLALIAVLCFSFAENSFGQDLKAEKIAELNVLINPPTMAGSKIIYPIIGGTIRGEINGNVLPIGADFGTLVSPTNFKLDVREVIQTDDGATIYVTYTGFIHADAETFGLLLAGRAGEVSPDRYYFRVNPVFETTSEKYDWLNHTLAVGVGRVTETGVSYILYAIR